MRMEVANALANELRKITRRGSSPEEKEATQKPWKTQK